MAGNLDIWLGYCYGADVLGKGSIQSALSSLKWRLAKGSQLESEARKKMQELSLLPEGRCFISKKHLEYLRKILT